MVRHRISLPTLFGFPFSEALYGLLRSPSPNDRAFVSTLVLMLKDRRKAISVTNNIFTSLLRYMRKAAEWFYVKQVTIARRIDSKKQKATWEAKSYAQT